MPRSIFMPPEVEPEQPQKKEQQSSTTMHSGGHRVVSAVANPVVVLMDMAWKQARRRASGKR